MPKVNAIIKYFLSCSRLSLDILRARGVKGLLLAMDRFLIRIKGGRVEGYSPARDYTPGLVTIAILTKNRLDLIRPCIESIGKYRSRKYEIEILIGDTGTNEAEVLQFYRNASDRYKNIKVIILGNYHFSKNYNQLISNHACGQYLILLNNDTLVTENWLDNLIDPLADKNIGIVGAKLLYPDNTIQHAGIEFNEHRNAYHVYRKQPRNLPEADFPAVVPGVTFACVALRHDVFDRFQLDENFKDEAQDTDFCLRLAAAGFKVLYNPVVEVYHLECSSRDWRRGILDRVGLQKMWAPTIKKLMAQDTQRLRFDRREYSHAITILRDGGIGDLLMGICAFKKLRERHPGKKLILATYQQNIPMMAGFKIFDEFIPIPDGYKFSPLPIPQASQVFNFINQEMDSGPRWGIPNDDNKVNRHLMYTRELGLDQDFELAPMPDYPADRQRVRQLLHDMKIDLGQRFVVLALTSTNPARSWWEPYYPRLLEAVKAMGFSPLVVGTTHTRYFKGPGIINLVGKTTNITEYIEAVKLGTYVISTDSSAYHIAALAGIPFLAIFTGGVKPAARLNFYKNYEAVEPPASLACYPCWDEGCKDLSIRWKSDPCRMIITPEEVIAKFKRLVANSPVH